MTLRRIPLPAGVLGSVLCFPRTLAQRLLFIIFSCRTQDSAPPSNEYSTVTIVPTDPLTQLLQIPKCLKQLPPSLSSLSFFFVSLSRTLSFLSSHLQWQKIWLTTHHKEVELMTDILTEQSLETQIGISICTYQPSFSSIYCTCS